MHNKKIFNIKKEIINLYNKYPELDYFNEEDMEYIRDNTDNTKHLESIKEFNYKVYELEFYQKTLNNATRTI